MIKIIEELDAASNLLRAALDRYLSVCSALKGCYTQINTASYFPRELLHRVTDELPLVSSYETRITEAKVTLSLSRNSFPTIVPINVLPDEILSRIFHLVLDSQPSTIESSNPIFRKDIDVCPLVCSRWRRISVSLGTLWSHIELCLVKSREQSVARAVVYAARAGRTPLDVHIVDSHRHRYFGPQYNRNCSSVTRFLASIGPRIKFLTFRISRLSCRYSQILNSCLPSCVPGVLTRLVLNVPSDGQFLAADEDSLAPRPGSRLINVPKQHLESLWLHTRVLHLYGSYPLWTSQAYHGLTKLHLLPGSREQIYIPERQLIEILESSPQLRVFRFGLTITDSLPADVPVAPAHLRSLEVLGWESRFDDQPGTFLRVIAPGLKSLQVSISRANQEDSVSLLEMKRFFARSNVTKLRLGISDFSGLAPALLGPLPPLEVLVLDYSIDIPPLTSEHHTEELIRYSTHPSCFQTLYLIRCHTHMDELQQVIKGHSVQTLTIKLGRISTDSTPSGSVIGINEDELKETLLKSCPAVKYPGQEDELEDWIELI